MQLSKVGVALAAILSLAACMAQPAFAEEEGRFVWDPDATYLTAQLAGSQQFSFIGSLNFECDTVEATVHVDESQEATTLETEGLTYGTSSKGSDKCFGPFGTSPTIEMNECQYVFHAGTLILSDESEGNLTINCPMGKQIVFNAAGCVVTIPGGQTIGPVLFIASTGPEQLRFFAKAEQLKYSTSGFLCGTRVNETNGTYRGQVWFGAETFGGVPTGVWLE